MTCELPEGTRILSAGEVELPTGEFSRVQYVLADFAQGKAPELWKGFPDGESNWSSLPPEKRERMAEQMKDAIAKGAVKDLCLSFDPWGEDYFLSVDFDQGWAAPLYNACDECGAAPCDPDRPDGLEDAPVEIGGQTPVPKMFALEDMEKAARVILCFLEAGKLSPETKWAVNGQDGLPW